MNVLGFQVGALTPERLAAFRASAFTYDHVGSTLEGPPPAGPAERYEHRRIVGPWPDGARTDRVPRASPAKWTGPERFDRARDSLRSWAPQRALGARVHPPGVTPEHGETAVLGVGLGRARLQIPTRVVAVVDDEHRWGYAYGTLPGHPEAGEELFLVELLDDGRVQAPIRVDSRPAPGLRWLGPLLSLLQRRAVDRYLRAVADAAGDASP